MAKKQRAMRRVAEGIYVRDGRYFVRLYDPATRSRVNYYPDEQGKPNTQTAAKQLKRELEQRKARRGKGRDETVRSFAARWMRDFGERRAESTRAHNTERVQAFIHDFGDRKLGEITRREARLWVAGGVASADLREVAEKWRGVEEVDGEIRVPSHHGNHPAVRAMYSDARDDELVDENPFTELRLQRPRGRRDILVLTEQEVGKLEEIAYELFGEAQGVVLAGMISTEAWTGIRPGEICAVKWPNIDFASDEIEVEWQFNSKTGKFERPKNKEPRRVVLPFPAAEKLKLIPRSVDGFVFHTQQGSPFTQRTLHYYWDKIRQRFTGGLPKDHHLRLRLAKNPKADLDFYELRHFCATYMLDMRGQSGEPLFSPQDVAYQLGHTDGGKLVMDTYGHPEESRARERAKEAFRRHFTAPAEEQRRRAG